MNEPERNLDSQWLDGLLSQPDFTAQRIYLQGAGLLRPAGLERLVTWATRLATQDPDRARRLAGLCARVADPSLAPQLIPQARYVQAQALAIQGDLRQAQELIRQARDGYLAQGETGAALRTDLGLMNVLGELGRFQDAIDTGLRLLAQVRQNGMPPSEAALLTAMAQRNLGICYRRLGRYQEALAAFTAAEAQYRALGIQEPVAHLQVNHGIVLINLGQARQAASLLEDAASYFQAQGNRRMWAKSLNNLGLAHQLLGQYGQALATLEQASRLFQEMEAGAEGHILRLDMGDLHLALNLYPEALDAYQEAGAGLEEAGMIYFLARARWGQGATLAALHRLGEAEEALAIAAELFRQADNAPMLAGVLLEEAALLARRKERDGALRRTRQAYELVAGEAWPVQKVFALLRLADLLWPDLEQVETLLGQAEAVVQELSLPHLSYRLHQRLGRLRMVQGRDDEARPRLEAAIETVEQLRGTLAQEALRTSFLSDKLTAYEDLVLLHLRREDQQGVAQAFAIAEQAKSRALVDLLAGLAATRREGVQDPELAARLEALQADLNILYNQLFSGGASGERHLPLDGLTDRVRLLEQEMQRLRLQATPTLGSSGLDGARDPHLPLETLRHSLPPGATMLAYHIAGQEILAFVQRGGELRVVRRLSSLPRIRALCQRLAIQWDRFRVGSHFTQRHMPQMIRSAQQLLGALHRELIAPLEPLLPPATAQEPAPLLIIPHGQLHQVPFHALFDGEGYLLEHFQVSYAPSVTVFALCQQRTPRRQGGALVLGADDPSIPFVAEEVQAVARHLPGARVFLGAGATHANLQRHAPQARLLHLACHGLFRGDNPMFSALKLQGEWLTASQVMALELTGAQVTLSACESGRHQVLAGDEILGLSRAFLSAGAASLVVSLWLVEDRATAQLMDDWYGRVAQGEGRVSALRAAQLRLKERHPHPYFWAPFVLMGQMEPGGPQSG